MKHHVTALARAAALLAAIAVIACGGKQTVASKSAAAYDEAKKKGIPVAAGEHGGHSAEVAMPEMDHPNMPGMQHGPSATGGHKMAGMDHGAMAGMDHSKMPGMQHAAAGAHDMAGMDHSAMPGMQHGGSMAGMQHGSAAAAPMVIAPPTSNSAIAQTQPAATLRADELDAPAPTSIEEAAKARRQPPSDHHDHSNGEAS
ncbi:MAG TPA: hypothetical protein VII32_18025 [Thermoanaerobaculia bacterium]